MGEVDIRRCAHERVMAEMMAGPAQCCAEGPFFLPLRDDWKNEMGSTP
jgi:hypothetical protein